MRQNKNVYIIYGESRSTGDTIFYGHVAGSTEEDAIKNAETNFHKSINDKYWNRHFSAVQVVVKGFKVIAQKLEDKVNSE